jgi:Spy/CpxP family protein refolding chaperone
MRLVAVVLGAMLSVSTLQAQGAASASGSRNHPAHRAQLEQRFHEKSFQIVRKKLDLSDQQMRQLRTVNDRIAPRRRDLGRQAAEVQRSLRVEVAKGASADQKKVAQLMDKATALREQQAALNQQEQKELSGFLTPVQRAKYVAIQSELRQRIQHLLERKNGRGLDSALLSD